MSKAELLSQIRRCLHSRYADRLQGIVLYGSEARGDAGPDSDIDLLVLLQGPIDYARDMEANLEALYPLSLRVGRRISAKPVEADEYRTAECPLYNRARLEGTPV